MAIVGGPKGKANGSVSVGILLDGHVNDLVIARPFEPWLCQRSDETLMVVGCRVNKVAEQLEMRPFSFSP